MLHPAHVGHLSVLRALIRDGAVRGGFDRELATDSRESTMFFSNLRRALTTGYFIEEDPATGDLTTVAVPGYVYHPDRGGGASRPIGFGLFKAIARTPRLRGQGPALRPRQPRDGAPAGLVRIRAGAGNGAPQLVRARRRALAARRIREERLLDRERDALTSPSVHAWPRARAVVT